MLSGVKFTETLANPFSGKIVKQLELQNRMPGF